MARVSDCGNQASVSPVQRWVQQWRHSSMRRVSCLKTRKSSTKKITATQVMVDEVAVSINAQFVEELTALGQPAPAGWRVNQLPCSLFN